MLYETQVRDNVWVWTLGGESIATSYGSNCTAVAGRDAVLLIDPFIAPAHARLVEKALGTKTGVPLRHVVLTHHHTDHALGAGWFASQGVEVIAHRACRERMAAEHPGLIASRRKQPDLADLFRDAEPYLPSRTFEEDLTIDLGETEAHVFHPGHNHTPGDAVVHFPKESAVVCGDLVSAGYHVNYEDAALDNLENGINFLRSLGARTCVPGHGPAGGPELLATQSRYHSAIRGAASKSDASVGPGRIRSLFPGYLLEEVLSLPLPPHPTSKKRARETGRR